MRTMGNHGGLVGGRASQCMCFHVQLWWTAIGRDQAVIKTCFDFRRYAMKPIPAEPISNIAHVEGRHSIWAVRRDIRDEGSINTSNGTLAGKFLFPPPASPCRPGGRSGGRDFGSDEEDYR
jgi:hypothetical protein